MFRSTQNKGLQISFSNGFEVSVQFGPGNYCERNTEPFGSPMNAQIWESKDAEVAVFDADGKFIPNSTDDVNGKLLPQPTDSVKGWVSADDVARLISFVSDLPGDSGDRKKVSDFLDTI